ncbi:MAG TPA: DUF192 domain-containing protein [Oscillatoriaceae cyanobacterium]
MTFAITNARTGAVLAERARRADNFFTRFRGLMWTKALPEGEALLIVPCNSVHCFNMRYTIDVLFLSRDGVVVKAIPGMKPGSVSPIVKGARATLELPEGTIARTGTQEGDRLELPAIG